MPGLTTGPYARVQFEGRAGTEELMDVGTGWQVRDVERRTLAEAPGERTFWQSTVPSSMDSKGVASIHGCTAIYAAIEHIISSVLAAKTPRPHFESLSAKGRPTDGRVLRIQQGGNDLGPYMMSKTNAEDVLTGFKRLQGCGESLAAHG
ncbi:hypothetical protein AK812_SmicGene49066 [Symbiodinium microadriaticum]|uniref:Uncharacterized protein n=1 Tax=Symbiodinium microadriaticum TaxID=2951 RepID=A0A1Q9CRG4_SYMMI|nr:hypothetical protein AK812_SmicGene49066 [Symbiodinium microadriaticum]